MNSDQYVYHYHAFYQQSAGVQHVDSVALRTLPILTGEDLTVLRKTIADQENFEDVDRVILCSVSLLFAPAALSEERQK